MRYITNFNSDWEFSLHSDDNWEKVTLPHTWNNLDGQDGGNDYYRGKCTYRKTILKKDLPLGEEHYLEINGANLSSVVYLNGEKLKSHDGGYSTYRVRLKDLRDENILEVTVDNSPSDRVYPQTADFTFYGGLYRDVRLITLPSSHFSLENLGTPGIKATPDVKGTLDVEVEVDGDYDSILYTLLDREGRVVLEENSRETKVTLSVSSPHLWNGRKDPYLYYIKVELLKGEERLDEVGSEIGFRSFRIDPERGFILNGEEYPLRGVSRHQDRKDKGNAISKEDHEEDMALIMEVGANTIRLAHYQHDQYFYHLCDKNGIVVWAEIPYISQHMSQGR